MEGIKRFLTVDYGSGYGDGNGSGNGNGYGNGYGIKNFCGQDVHIVDGVQTIITKIRGNIAKGFILQSDLTLTPCFVVKSENTFAHGKTLHEAQEALTQKIFEDMPEDERIEAFISEFEHGKKYPGKVFFEWHNKLTGSCLAGRTAFVKDLGADLENDMYTVDEFITLTENAYGGSVIQALKDRWNDNGN
ncbi:MAG: hypothetical protein IJ299_04820 [Oscillospiraceae bacterium]|nr:hypothetical protein [Oscillospiraceae bacterium]